jgi:hypothetical protein
MVEKQEYFIDKCKYIWTGEKRGLLDYTILTIGIYPICVKDMMTLLPTKWLNGDIIDVFGTLITKY